MATKTKAVKARATCLICKKNKPYSRGACQSCLADVRELVRIGQTTDDELVKDGLLLRKLKLGPKRMDSPLVTLLKARKRK
jgi:hypothetical protein